MVNYHFSKMGLSWFEVDLRVERQLREDKKRTGQIKKHRIQPVHPIFMPIINIIYEKHKNLISRYDNSYQPLFINQRGRSMMKGSYSKKFKEIIDLVIKRMSSHPDIYVRSEANILLSGKIGPHLLRYYFTQFIASLDTTQSATELAYWRGDRSLDASICYLRKSPQISEKLKIIQNETIETILKG